MEQYFKLINTSMHGQPGSKIESESFYHDFRLPKSYEIPKMRETSDQSQHIISAQKMKHFPDKVLFYIFYNMPHDKAQLNAANELHNRSWIFCKDTVRWVQSNSTSNGSSKKEINGKKGKQITRNTSKKQDSSIIVFNPLLWKEEVVTLLED